MCPGSKHLGAVIVPVSKLTARPLAVPAMVLPGNVCEVCFLNLCVNVKLNVNVYLV